MPGGMLPPASGSGPPWPQSAPTSSASGGGAWHGPPSYPVRVDSPSSSVASSSKLKTQDKGGNPAGQGSSSTQKQQVDILSPQNSELRKTGSISSLRDALLATTAASSPAQQYPSYSSPRMADHQRSPMTPSSSLPTDAGPGMVISPQISVTGPARQDSQLSAGGQSMEQDESQQMYSRQNSAVAGGVRGGAANTPHQSEEGSRVSPLQVESILGIKGDQPVDPSLSNSMREGGGGGSNVNSPHTQSPHGGGSGGIPGVAQGIQDGKSPAPGRPELLGFPAKSPSFRSMENQPSPLTEDGKTVSGRGVRAILCTIKFSLMMFFMFLFSSFGPLFYHCNVLCYTCFLFPPPPPPPLGKFLSDSEILWIYSIVLLVPAYHQLLILFLTQARKLTMSPVERSHPVSFPINAHLLVHVGLCVHAVPVVFMGCLNTGLPGVFVFQ